MAVQAKKYFNRAKFIVNIEQLPNIVYPTKLLNPN